MGMRLREGPFARYVCSWRSSVEAFFWQDQVLLGIAWVQMSHVLRVDVLYLRAPSQQRLSFVRHVFSGTCSAGVSRCRMDKRCVFCAWPSSCVGGRSARAFSSLSMSRRERADA